MATLTKQIINDLTIGNACIKVINQTNSITDSSFTDADKFFTYADTLSIVQEEMTRTDVKIDQYDETIGGTYESGAYTISGEVPSTAIEAFEYFWDKSTVQPTLTSGITADDGVTKFTSATAFNLNSKKRKATILVESQDHRTAVIFTNVELTAVQNWETVRTEPYTINFSGSIMTPTAEGVGAFIVLKSATPTT